MNADCVLDTNVLVYAVGKRGQHEEKRTRARELVRTQKFGISGQILQEFYVTVTRKAKRPETSVSALRWIEQLEKQPCVSIDASLVKISIEISQRYQISYWDAAVIAAAERLGATTLYTEDLNHGQSYGPVRAINPFVDA